VLKKLLAHAEWADAEVWRTVLASPETLYEPKVSFWLHHVHTVQHAFPRLWTGRPLDIPELPAFEGAEALAAWGREGHETLRGFLEAASPDDLARAFETPWADRLTERFGRKAKAVTVGESAFQVALHSMHHRGQITARIRELGGEPPLVDFIAWIWLGRPGAAWREAAPPGA